MAKRRHLCPAGRGRRWLHQRSVLPPRAEKHLPRAKCHPLWRILRPWLRLRVPRNARSPRHPPTRGAIGGIGTASLSQRFGRRGRLVARTQGAPMIEWLLPCHVNQLLKPSRLLRHQILSPPPRRRPMRRLRLATSSNAAPALALLLAPRKARGRPCKQKASTAPPLRRPLPSNALLHSRKAARLRGCRPLHPELLRGQGPRHSEVAGVAAQRCLKVPAETPGREVSLRW